MQVRVRVFSISLPGASVFSVPKVKHTGSRDLSGHPQHPEFQKLERPGIHNITEATARATFHAKHHLGEQIALLHQMYSCC